MPGRRTVVFRRAPGGRRQCFRDHCRLDRRCTSRPSSWCSQAASLKCRQRRVSIDMRLIAFRMSAKVSSWPRPMNAYFSLLKVLVPCRSTTLALVRRPCQRRLSPQSRKPQSTLPCPQPQPSIPIRCIITRAAAAAGLTRFELAPPLCCSCSAGNSLSRLGDRSSINSKIVPRQH